MNLIDMRTIILSYTISNTICLTIMALLWLRNRHRFAGLGFWLADFAMQFVVIWLVALRVILPDVLSIVVSNALVIAGTILLLIGLEQFVGKRASQVHNYFLLGAFILVHSYFTFIQPSLLIRTINLAVGIILITSQCAWLLIYRADARMRLITRGVGYIFLAFCLSSLARIVIDLVVNPGHDFFQLGTFEAWFTLTNQMLFIILTLGLLLMVNQHLVTDLEGDIVERKRAEDALQRNEALLLQTGEIAKVGGWKLDLETMTLTWSSETYRIHEVDPSTQPDLENAINYYAPEARPQIAEAVRQATEEGQSYDLELPVVTAKGRQIWVRTMGQAEFRDGVCVGLLGTFQDITERRQAEEALRRFELLSANSKDIILFMRRADGRIMEANAAALSAYGYSHDELLALTVQDLRARDTQNLTADQMAQADAGGILFETIHRRRDGSTFPVEVSSQGATIGAVRTLVSIVRDVTARKRAEAEITTLSKFPTENPYPVLRVQNDGRVIYANAASQELLAMWGCEINDYLPVEMKDILNLAVETHSNRTVDVPCNARVYSITLVPIVDSGYVNLYGSDITERKQAEEKMQRSEATLRAVLDQMPSGVTVRDALSGQLLLSNARSQEILSTIVDSPDHFDHYRGFHADGLPYRNEDWPLSRSIATGEVIQAEEVNCRRSDDSWFTLSINSAPVRDLQGQVVMGVGVFDDITERKQAEGALQRMTEDLQRSNAELEQFAYVASHDLQEPLRMVSSYMQLLAKRYQGKLDGDADEFIAFAVDGAKRMQNLINDLLTYSRVGTRTSPPASVSCTRVLEETLKNLQFAIEESSAIITHERLPVVKADPIQLAMVFQNLLGNAIKFHGSEPPHINIEAQQRRDEWIFSVRDNGIGFDPKFAERIFVIFQRLHDRSKYSGTGIGLAICKRIIQRHSGRIWVESQPGEGSTFYFTLPAGGTDLT